MPPATATGDGLAALHTTPTPAAIETTGDVTDANGTRNERVPGAVMATGDAVYPAPTEEASERTRTADPFITRAR